jgi:5-methylcytosine-specific restriction endonuclease McrA
VKQSPDHLSWGTLSALVTRGAACAHCGSREDLVAHHKVPRKMGGLDVLENLEPVCRSCHPRIERESVAEAATSWERPEWPERLGPKRRRPNLIRPY